MKEIISYVVVIAVVLLLSYGGWRAKRWVNWKFGYKDKVETRIKSLESRVDALEGRKSDK
jgi:hypothetical protein